MRRSLTLALAAVPVLAASIGLVACSATPTCDATPPGPASKAVTVTGDLNGEVTVAIDGTLAPTTTERSVVLPGSGAEAMPGQTVRVFYSVFKGSDGTLIESGLAQSADPTPFVLDDTVMLPGVVKTLTCSVPGSRVVGVIPPGDGFGDDGTQLGLAAGEPLVFVGDVVSIEDTPTPTQAPSAQTVEKDSSLTQPTVDLSTNPPTITLPTAAPPTALDVQVITPGTGSVVASDASVTVNYLGVNWDTAVVFDESYSSAPATFSLDGVVPGFAQAIAGQTVGSTILVTIPPGLAYGADSGNPDTSGTLVFVIEIISAQ